jgi:hypothetical protein
MPSPQICELYRKFISDLEKVLPADEKTVEQAQSLVAELEQAGATGTTLDNANAALAQAQSHLDDDTNQLQVFQDEYEALGCPGTRP